MKPANPSAPALALRPPASKGRCDAALPPLPLAGEGWGEGLRRLLLSTSAVLLSACSPSNQGNDWFPLREGDTQTLAVSFVGDEAREPEQWTMSVRAPSRFDEQPVAVRHHSAGVSYYLRVDAQGIRRVATRTDIDNEPTADEEPLWVLKTPYQVGTEWTSTTVPYLLQRKNEYPRELKYSHKAPMTWRIEALESLKLSDGTELPRCLRVVGTARLTLYTDPVNGFTEVPLISREWYCEGVGLVKLVREEKVPTGFLTGGVLTAEWVKNP